MDPLGEAICERGWVESEGFGGPSEVVVVECDSIVGHGKEGVVVGFGTGLGPWRIRRLQPALWDLGPRNG